MPYIRRYQVKGKTYYALVERVKRKDGKWGIKTLESYGTQKPIFYAPIILGGMAEAFLPMIPDKSVHLILTDPPYGMTPGEWDATPDWKWLSGECHRILRDSGQLALHGWGRMLVEASSIFLERFDFRFEVVWKKNRPTCWISNYEPLRIHELIHVFKKHGTSTRDLTFNVDDLKTKGDPYTKAHWSPPTHMSQSGWTDGYTTVSDGMRWPLDVIDAPQIGEGHPERLDLYAQKPEKLIDWFIRGLSNRGDVILDPYIGSGTVAACAIPRGRKSIGIEANPRVLKILTKRLLKILEKYPTNADCRLTTIGHENELHTNSVLPIPDWYASTLSVKT